MPFSSSPVLYPPSSSPPVVLQKRKLFQTSKPLEPSLKRWKSLAGFVDDDDSDEDRETHEISVTKHPVIHKTLDIALEARQSYSNQDNGLSGPALLQQQKETKRADQQPQLHQSSFRLTPKTTEVQLDSGKRLRLARRVRNVQQSYQQVIAERSHTEPGAAKKAYYGVDIHRLVDECRIQKELDNAAAEYKRQNPSVESIEESTTIKTATPSGKAYQMWTEKYRARKFTELVGDERTHRSVLRWLKSWDPVVFPGTSKNKPKRIYEDQDQQQKKILLLTGPPGLGKTTLAHVCARQAGYEVLEINASDDRSRDVVKGRIKDALGTETVRGVQQQGKQRVAARPVCVVVDEVDGVVTGSGGSGGEGGFMRALIDLVQLDQRNASARQTTATKKAKGDKFRLLRPLILICNDVYAPSLRPLRQSSIAEIVHVRKPAIEKVITRVKTIFERESISCDVDAVRRLCESSWGLGTRKQNSLGGRGAGDGDIRGVLVQGEWMAQKLRASKPGDMRLTRRWVEEHVNSSTASQDGLGRGGVKEVVDRIFIEGAGLPNLPTALSKDEARMVAESNATAIGVADLRKRSAITALRGMIDMTGEHDRLMTECFTTYPMLTFQDDTVLTKPNAGYDWLHFHDSLSHKVHSGQEWELNPYLSTSACGFHDLFATVDRGSRGWSDDKASKEEPDTESHPFSGAKADFAAYEAEKANRATLSEMQAGFSAPLLRLFNSVDTMATDMVPTVSRMLAPDVKPVVVGGSGSMASVASVRKESEKMCVQNAVRVMHGLGVQFEKVKIESEGFGAHANGGYAYRMEPPLDSLATFHFPKPPTTDKTSGTYSSKNLPQTTLVTTAPVRYAVRQVLSQELSKEKAIQANLSRQARGAGLSVASLSTHPLSSTNNNNNNTSHSPHNPNEDNDNNKENNPPVAKGLKNIEQLTAIAAATATLSRAPGSATLLNNNNTTAIKKDFFGRPIITPPPPASTSTRPSSSRDSDVLGDGKTHHRRTSSLAGAGAGAGTGTGTRAGAGGKNTTAQNGVASEQGGGGGGGGGAMATKRTWVSFHEGYSNAVRKYISLNELMDGF